MPIRLNEKYLKDFVRPQELDAMRPQVAAAAKQLEEGSGLGNEYLGWLRLPECCDRAEIARIKKAASAIQQNSELLVVIGIGGSYLGARAAIELLRSPFSYLSGEKPQVVFAGCNLSPEYHAALLDLCRDREFSINVVSKSGTTTEPALAFRMFRDLLLQRYGEQEAARRIYCTTDRSRGTLKGLADREGYESFVIPDDVGGRYSVLTPVGLLPIAAAGLDIDRMFEGARAAQRDLAEPDLDQNPCYRYAALRSIFYRRGKQMELFASFHPAFAMMNEWLKQLFGESEGKDGKGLFPASVIFSTDLHSMGQYIQDGRRSFFETMIDIRSNPGAPRVETEPENLDGLNFLAGKTFADINRSALEGTALAHTGGGVPVVLLELADRNEYEFGYLVYFFEKACAVSGYLLGVNPFDQPGVEAYKKNMFALLGKPGYEELRAKLLERL